MTLCTAAPAGVPPKIFVETACDTNAVILRGGLYLRTSILSASRRIVWHHTTLFLRGLFMYFAGDALEDQARHGLGDLLRSEITLVPVPLGDRVPHPEDKPG
jgi:hypothetical protein